MDQCKITHTRRAFDRALRALPLTQHHRIWPLYIKFVRKHNVVETTLRVYRRYMKVCTWPMCEVHTDSVQVCPENTEEFIDYLKSIGHLDEAARKLAEIVNRVRLV